MSKKVSPKQEGTRDIPGTIARWVGTRHLGHHLPESRTWPGGDENFQEGHDRRAGSSGL